MGREDIKEIIKYLKILQCVIPICVAQEKQKYARVSFWYVLNNKPKFRLNYIVDLEDYSG